MTQALVSARNVHLVYPVYTIRAQSLRASVLNLAVGGKLMRDGRDVTHVRALDNVSFDLEDGDRLGLIGHNGSGKTTLLKVIAGIYFPTSGDISVRGQVSSMLDIGLGVDWESTGMENIISMGRLRGLTKKEILNRVPDIVEFSDLGAFIDLPLKTYSTGMATRLVFAVATSFHPDILVLDEWLGAGDSSFISKASARMQGVASAARAVVLSSHSQDLIRSFCNKVGVMEAGKMTYFGSADEYFSRIA